MEPQGVPFTDARLKRILIGASIQEIKAWRAKEFAAGRPSGLNDYCRANGLLQLCSLCRGEGLTPNDNGVGYKPVGWKDSEQLFEQCPSCGGTGRLINPSI